MQGDVPKQYLPLAGKSVIEHSLAPFLAEQRVDGLVVALRPDDEVWPRVAPHTEKPLLTAPGGAERSDSVLAALEALGERVGEDEWVLVHDAARPCLRIGDLAKLIGTLEDDPVGGLLAVPAHDTLKRVGPGGRVEATIDRGQVWLAQTPQMFRLGLLRSALREAAASGTRITDEASALERAGFHPRVVEGHSDNLKVTRPADLHLAELLLDRARAGEPCA